MREVSDDLAKSEWRQITECYAWLVVLTGIPCAGLSLHFWTPTVFVGWLHCIVALPIIMAGITLLWSITAYPLLLLLGVLVGRGKTSEGSPDPDGPGVIICPFGAVAASRAQRPTKAVPSDGHRWDTQ